MTSRETFGDRTRTHGMTNTRLYAQWCGMKCRCYNPNYKFFHRYGGRGICVCKEWRKSFEAFRDWAKSVGYDETLSGKEQSIDRIDPNGNYEPNNCRFISMKRQRQNREDTVYVKFNGKKENAREFARKNNIEDYAYVYRKAKKGVPGEDIILSWNMIHKTPSNYMTVKDAMNTYNVTDMTIRSWIKKDKLKAEKVEGRWYILK